MWKAYQPMMYWLKLRNSAKDLCGSRTNIVVSVARQGIPAVIVLCALFIAPSAGFSATPTEIQHRGCPSGGATAYTTFVCPLNNPTLAGNVVITAIQYGVNGANTATITDDKSDTFTLDLCANSGTNQTTCIYHVFPTTGAQVITVTNSSASSFMDMWSGEYNNVSAKDNCQSGHPISGTSLAVGTNMTFAASNDLIVLMAEQDNSGSVTSWTAGSQANITWGLSQNDIGFGSLIDQAVQWGVYTTTTAFAPAITVAPAVTSAGVVACGFTSNSSGTAAPAGMYISSLEHYNVVAASSGFKIGAPLNGNAAYLFCTDAPNQGNITAITASGGETVTKVGEIDNQAGGGLMMVWETHNATLTRSDVWTLTTGIVSPGTTSNFASADCLLYGIANAATNPLDTSITAGTNTTCTSGFCTATGNQSVAGTTVTGTQTTPSVTGEILLSRIGVAGAGMGQGDIRGVSAPQISDTAYSGQEASANEMDENNGAGHYGASLSAVTFTWTERASIAIGNWVSDTIGIKAPNNFTPQFNKQRKLEQLDASLHSE